MLYKIYYNILLKLQFSIILKINCLEVNKYIQVFSYNNNTNNLFDIFFCINSFLTSEKNFSSCQ